MNLIESIQSDFQAFLSKLYPLGKETIAHCKLLLNTDEKKQQFGDLTTSSALLLAKKLDYQPRVIAQQIVDSFTNAMVERIEVAGPGFINMYLKNTAWGKLVQELSSQEELFFKPTSAQNKHINIEFVSANPTGPLHFGHGRGGILGDVITKILRFLGYNVTAEFYINDAGVQIEKLGLSFKIRCQQALGLDVVLPEDAYHGDYLVQLAQDYVKTHGAAALSKDDSFFALYAQDQMLANIKKTLVDYGISFDVWFSEKSLHTSDSISRALAILEKRDFLYNHDGALWFRSTVFGDDKDRVVRKADGILTYIAADIAYLQNKIDRGAQKLIMVLGHDHHSYAVRLESVRQALGLTGVELDVILYQLVKIKQGTEQVKMSKRKGTIVSLQDVIDTVGKDVARFFYLHRKADAQLDFDLDLALKKTEENPVYYVQYAYVRTNSILDKAQIELTRASIDSGSLATLGEKEALLIKKIISLKHLLEQIGSNYQTHLLTHYVIELATLFHSYYRDNRVIDLAELETSRDRLVLIKVLNRTFKTVFNLLGISAPQRM